ncbi:hypothetical protein GCM10010149_88470 [Nonomuraea roseoviolacea subsp. roseoviolacea]|uniref:hypothetical protein n=1 Tax=Nonomuraea roseoviolacea TaxID=103837 RepID=UPI0031D9AD59
MSATTAPLPDHLHHAKIVLNADTLKTPSSRLAFLCLSVQVHLTGLPAYADEIAPMAGVSTATMRSYLNELVKWDLVQSHRVVGGQTTYLPKRRI